MMELPIFAAGFLGIEHFTPPWDVFFLPLLNGLVALYKLLFTDFLIAIVLFTVLIRTLLAPLFAKQIRSQKEMQRMQPLIKEVQRKYKGDRQKITQETMALYKEHGVNPAAGCLPLLIQMPILFALYQVLTRASGRITGFRPEGDKLDAFNELRSHLDIQSLPGDAAYRIPVDGACNAPGLSQVQEFLPLNCQLLDPIKLSSQVDTVVEWLRTPWVTTGLDLADIDRVFSFSIFGGFVVSGLAILAGLLTFVQAKMAQPGSSASGPDQAPDPTMQATATMTYLFPLMYVFWGGIFPSGLIVYWIVYSAYVIVQQYLMMGWGNLFPIFGWTPGFARSAATTGIVVSRDTIRGEVVRSDKAGARPESDTSETRQPKSPSRPAAQHGRSGSQKRRRGRKAR